MKNIPIERQIEALTNFLKNVTENESLYVHSMNKGKNVKFCVAEKSETGGVIDRSNFMTYEEMNCYFFGVLAVKENRINF